ncbi:uncharacterized protein LAJ45_04769 [Morchella importuna]|uniref:uncharacterized protein n=1 Tax=Morchella importuna TaxID=1174673 RepID=UPI001E8EB8D8|nr:uncharacterized protein LAJ45_04769 [Morchella importuna]KAH8151067.1 hypothetical protein LAJ45_04769 [Morchella importuna]
MIYEACQSSLGIKWYALILSESSSERIAKSMISLESQNFLIMTLLHRHEYQKWCYVCYDSEDLPSASLNCGSFIKCLISLMSVCDSRTAE